MILQIVFYEIFDRNDIMPLTTLIDIFYPVKPQHKNTEEVVAEQGKDEDPCEFKAGEVIKVGIISCHIYASVLSVDWIKLIIIKFIIDIIYRFAYHKFYQQSLVLISFSWSNNCR